MVESRSGAGLLKEAALASGIADVFGRQDLHGYQPVEPGVARFVHDSHPAFAQFLD
jgi:hypothetical protein